jgi:hypothetical protein
MENYKQDNTGIYRVIHNQNAPVFNSSAKSSNKQANYEEVLNNIEEKRGHIKELDKQKSVSVQEYESLIRKAKMLAGSRFPPEVFNELIEKAEIYIISKNDIKKLKQIRKNFRDINSIKISDLYFLLEIENIIKEIEKNFSLNGYIPSKKKNWLADFLLRG